MRFTVRRPDSAEVSPCCHRPSGGDVACGVHVGIARPCAAGDALENRLALAVFRRDVPAVGASLRHIRCRDDLQPPAGFVRQSGHAQSGCQPAVFAAGPGTLLVIPGHLATRLPVPLLLDRKIPHKPGMATVFNQNCRLLNTGKQTKPAHTHNLGTITDNMRKGGNRRLPQLRPGGLPRRKSDEPR